MTVYPLELKELDRSPCLILSYHPQPVGHRPPNERKEKVEITGSKKRKKDEIIGNKKRRDGEREERRR